MNQNLNIHRKIRKLHKVNIKLIKFISLIGFLTDFMVCTKLTIGHKASWTVCYYFYLFKAIMMIRLRYSIICKILSHIVKFFYKSSNSNLSFFMVLTLYEALMCKCKSWQIETNWQVSQVNKFAHMFSSTQLLNLGTLSNALIYIISSKSF